jgi:hypothetical protein
MQQKSKFDMPGIRRKCRKVLKKKHGKTIRSLREVDRLWKNYIKYAIVEELIKYGKVSIDSNFSMEIVGEHIADNPKMFAIFSRGIGVKNGMVTKGANLFKGRDGLFYKIELTDKNFKEGKLYFTACPEIKAAVHNALVNTNHFYRIKK